MSDSYTKLFASITDSTIWAAPDATRLVWITMLAMSDAHGYVGASVPGLAARARVSIEDCVTALETFLAPDKWSRTPDYEGRRIEASDGGWYLLNHAKYRAIRNKELRNEKARIAMADRRAKEKARTVSNVSRGSPPFTHTEADTEVDTNKDLAPKKLTELSTNDEKFQRLFLKQGEELGLTPNVGESMDAFKARIKAARLNEARVK